MSSGMMQSRKNIPSLLSICQLDFLLFEVIDKFHPTLPPPSCPSVISPSLLSAASSPVCLVPLEPWLSMVCLCPFPSGQQSDQVEHGLNSSGFSYSFAVYYSLDLVLFWMSWISRDLNSDQ